MIGRPDLVRFNDLYWSLKEHAGQGPEIFKANLKAYTRQAKMLLITGDAIWKAVIEHGPAGVNGVEERLEPRKLQRALELTENARKFLALRSGSSDLIFQLESLVSCFPVYHMVIESLDEIVALSKSEAAAVAELQLLQKITSSLCTRLTSTEPRKENGRLA